MLSRISQIVFALALPLFLSGCLTTNPATGERQFTPFMSPSDEAQIGAEEHPKIIAQFGGQYDNPELVAYVERVGDALAAQSELPDLDFTFTVLNSDVVNAFALPGGYVYITRGLLSILNDEAELASVLGHEIGHVTARHTAQRYNRSVFAGLGAVIVGVATGNEQIANLVAQGSQLYLLSFSRSQELQADALGLRYMTRVNYQPRGAVRMMQSLDRATRLTAEELGVDIDQTPSWARTHPYADQRVERLNAGIAEQNLNPTAGTVNRGPLLGAVDGMIYGPDPEQGLIDGRRFTHPGFRVTFQAAQGFVLQNTASAVIGQNGSGDQFMFGVYSADHSLNAMPQAIWQALAGENAPALQNVRSRQVNGLSAASGEASISTDNGTFNAEVVAIEESAGRVFYFLFLNTPAREREAASGFNETLNSLRRISASEANSITAKVIDVVPVRSGDTVSSLAGRMALSQNADRWFLVLNGMDSASELGRFQDVKLVTE